MKILIVGAGVAGLLCGRMLHQAGQDVTVFEASDGVGGRVRSDNIDGYILDRGFQVLFTAYPAAKRHLDYEALNLQCFEPGAIIAQAATLSVLSDPMRDPDSLVPSLKTDIVSLEDKARTALLTQQLLGKSVDAIMEGPDDTTEHFLRHRGFTERFIDNFARPFFGGIFLNDSLQTSQKAFQFDWKMMAEGDTAIPMRGNGKISQHLAEELDAAGCIRLNSPVSELLRDPVTNACIGIRLESGEAITADVVVVATPAPETARLTHLPMPEGHTSTVNLYFAGHSPVYAGKKIVLHANQDAFVNNVAQVTNVAPELAPVGQHMISATVLGIPEGDDATLYQRAMKDIRRMFAGDPKALSALTGYRPIALYRLPYCQFAQPPGVYETLLKNETETPGLFLAGEFTAASSINAAMRSAEKCAQRILERTAATGN